MALTSSSCFAGAASCLGRLCIALIRVLEEALGLKARRCSRKTRCTAMWLMLHTRNQGPRQVCTLRFCSHCCAMLRLFCLRLLCSSVSSSRSTDLPGLGGSQHVPLDFVTVATSS